MQLLSWNIRAGGGRGEEEIRCRLEAQGYQVTRYTYPPGTHFPDHCHDMDKIDVVLSGCFEISMDGQVVILQAGQGVEVPKGVIHSARVIGRDPVVSLDAVKL